MEGLSKVCSRCMQEKPISEFYAHKRDGHTYWCKVCSHNYYLELKERGYFKEYSQRPNVKVMRANVKGKYRTHPYTKQPDLARCRAYRLVNRGLIERQPCVVCGDTNAEMHHPNYNEPGIVVFLCEKHHQELHKKEAQNG